MQMTLHLANTVALLERARSVREQVFTIEKQIPKSIEVDELDCLSGVCDHFVVELVAHKAEDGTMETTKGIRDNMLDEKNEKPMDICAFRCKKIEEKSVQLQRFCVLKEYRKAGVGRFALEQMEVYYWNQGIEKITLDAKFHVSEFYEQCGYVVVSEPFIEAGVEHVVMEKRRRPG